MGMFDKLKGMMGVPEEGDYDEEDMEYEMCIRDRKERGACSVELRLDRLTKQFGTKIAVDRVSLAMTRGVYGLLGANGAGKTTLMRMLCGILTPTSGEVLLDGRGILELGERYRDVLGYLPQDFGYYPEDTARGFLLYMAALKGLPRPVAQRRAEELLQTVSLQDTGKKKLKAFSDVYKRQSSSTASPFCTSSPSGWC